ncbi:uncharacterized protein C8A04DRAFT_33457 [Dichotomopilus funicola]|uniref:Metalloprotease n=1 Tax=Dichotomopilus funicola TaxID=1934379 RepID=A0AAN6UWD8_9PEZI|nr:hypothetical protein C8A04DRAFT_33457 [Dichotomopilus funicola]
MQSHICSIVPPYLLRGIAESQSNDDKARQGARNCLAHRERVTTKRAERFRLLSQPPATRAAANIHRGHRNIVPEVLLQHIADSGDVDDNTKARARGDIERTRRVTSAYQKSLKGENVDQPDPKDGGVTATKAGGKTGDDNTGDDAPPKDPGSSGFYRAVYDAKHSEDESTLPGDVLRVEGQAAVKDETANAAFDNVGRVLEFYLEQFKWKSIDNKNQHVISSVHFGQAYGNAFWDPEIAQMVFGDGDDFIGNFATCIDVIGHELTHAVTEHTSPLNYDAQPGALNEHVSDVFGIMIKQKYEDETADKADWLIGEGCLLPGVKGVALRSMKAPGTAYDDPRFGKDPQPANMSDYKPTTDDNGGVHLYSGIPNKAFYLASVAFGGYSWEKAGQIWWKTMSAGRVPASCTFVQFADATVDTAEELFGADAAKTVRDAWNQVGVTRKN